MKFIPKYKLLGHKGAIYKLIDINDQEFISIGGEGYIVLWQKTSTPQDGLLLAKDNYPVYTGFFDKDGDTLYIGKMDGAVSIVNLQDKLINKTYKAHQKSVYSIVIAENYILSGGGDGYISFYNKTTSKLEKSIQISAAAVRTLLVVGNLVYAGSSDGCLYSINIDNDDIQQTRVGELSIFSLCDYENRLLIGGRDCKIFDMNISAKVITKTVDAHRSTINDIIAMEDLVVSACRDKSIRIWTSAIEPVQSLTSIQGGHINSVNGLLKGNDLNSFYSCSDDKSIIYWTME